MKRFTSKAIAILFFAAILCISVFAYPTDLKNIVSVSGTGSVLITADTATIVLSVSTNDKIASIAASKNAELMTKVQEAIKQFGIEDKDISTQNFSLYQEREWKNNEEVLKDYRATNTLSVTIRNLTLVGKIIDASLSAGANQFSRLSFSTSDTTEAYEKARILAVEKAKKTAETLAKAAERKLGKAIIITEEPSYNDVMYETATMNSRDEMMMSKGAMPTPINAGTSNVSVTVQIVYELR